MTSTFTDLNLVGFATIEGLDSVTTSDLVAGTSFDLDNYQLVYSRFLDSFRIGEDDPHFHEFSLTLDLADADGLGNMLDAANNGQVFDEMTLNTFFDFGGKFFQEHQSLFWVTFLSTA